MPFNSTTDIWKGEGFQPEIGTFTAETWLDHWAEHDTVHLRQIERTLNEATTSENKR